MTTQPLSKAATALALAVVAAAVPVSAQWVQYRDPAIPRTRDGRPNLSAPAPRTADGKPDLSGVWMHELTSAAEVRRLFGPVIDERIKVDVPGMEIGTQHKYSFNVLLDYNATEMLRPAARERMGRRPDHHNPAALCVRPPRHLYTTHLRSSPVNVAPGLPIASILYAGCNTHRQIYMDGRLLPKRFDLPSCLR